MSLFARGRCTGSAELSLSRCSGSGFKPYGPEFGPLLHPKTAFKKEPEPLANPIIVRPPVLY